MKIYYIYLRLFLFCFFLISVGLVGLINKNMVSSLISKYAQVVLWFCRTGLLPEGSGRVSSQITSYVIISHC